MICQGYVSIFLYRETYTFKYLKSRTVLDVVVYVSKLVS